MNSNIYSKDSNINLGNYNNIRYSKNINNYWELGAIWFAAKQWQDINKFIIIQNSMILLKQFSEDIFDKDFISLWESDITNYSPMISWTENKLKDCNIIINCNNLWNSICGYCCLIDNNLLQLLINDNFDQILPTNKLEAVGGEILFGYLIHVYLNINEPPLHNFPISDYCNKSKEWIWIQKIGSRQGMKFIKQDSFNINKNLLPKINKYNDINDLLISLLKYINNNDDFAQLLINSFPKNIKTGNNKLDLVLSSIRHRMFTKKYFQDYYNKEFNDIISKNKIIF